MNAVPFKVKMATRQMAEKLHAHEIAHEDAITYGNTGISVHVEVSVANISGVTGTSNIHPSMWNADGSVAAYDVFYWYAYPPV